MRCGYGEELQLGLVKLQLENLGSLVVVRWYSAYHYSHPPAVERLHAIDALMQRQAAVTASGTGRDSSTPVGKQKKKSQ